MGLRIPAGETKVVVARRTKTDPAVYRREISGMKIVPKPESPKVSGNRHTVTVEFPALPKDTFLTICWAPERN